MENTEEELGGSFVITVDELGYHGLWESVREVRSSPFRPWCVYGVDQSGSHGASSLAVQVFEGRSPLANVTLHNKIGKPVLLEKLAVQ